MLLLMASLGHALAAEDDLTRAILDVREAAAAPVLICVAGQEADKATQRALRGRDDPGLRITRIPTMGDAKAEVERALADSGLRCAVRVAPENGGFSVTRHGDCSPVDRLAVVVASADPPSTADAAATPTALPPGPSAPGSAVPAGDVAAASGTTAGTADTPPDGAAPTGPPPSTPADGTAEGVPAPAPAASETAAAEAPETEAPETEAPETEAPGSKTPAGDSGAQALALTEGTLPSADGEAGAVTEGPTAEPASGEAVGSAEEDPPAEDPPEPVVVTAEEWAQREQLYNQQRLQILDLAPDPRRASGVEWELVDGRAAPMAAPDLAELANDDDLRHRLERERKGGKRATRAVFWTGVGIAALSPLPLIGVESGAFQENQDRAWTSIFLLASGGLTMSLSTGPKKFVADRQRHASLYVEPVTAEDVAIAHNQRLWQSLDLEHRPAPEPTSTDAGPQTVVIGGGSSNETDAAPPPPVDDEGLEGLDDQDGSETAEGADSAEEAPPSAETAGEGGGPESVEALEATPENTPLPGSVTPQEVTPQEVTPTPPESTPQPAPASDDAGTAGEGGAQ